MPETTKLAHYIALSGGVGGAKLTLGLSKILPPECLSIIANTGDDFEHLGLNICPDIDTLLYTLSDLNNKTLGWGRADESWQFMAALKELGGESWFQLGDKDLALHTLRTQLLKEGHSLTAVTRQLGQRLGINNNVIPMSDDPVRTIVKTSTGELPFQHYFVREQCQPTVSGFHFDGIESAQASTPFLDALQQPQLAAIIICPSNPFVSIDPILSLPGIREKMQTTNVIAVSPIIGGKAIKGPAAKMMHELNMPCTATAVCQHYGQFINGFVLDTVDADQAPAIESLGIKTLVTNTVMTSLDDRIQLAKTIQHWIIQLNN